MSMVPFIGPSYEHRSHSVSVQRSLNLYPELVADEGSKSKYILIGTPGSKLYKNLEGTDSGCRGMHTVYSKRDPAGNVTGRAFAVYGSKLIEIVNKTEEVVWGTISDLNTSINFCHNDEDLVFVDGVNMYTFTLETNVLAEVSGLPFTNPTDVVYVNERVVCINEDETFDVVRNYGKFYYSALNDAKSWPALNWDNTQSEADPIFSVEKREGELWLLGPASTEVWRTTTNAARPFARVTNSATGVGIGGKYASSAIANNVLWLGSSDVGKNQIFMSEGYNARRISTHAVEKALEDMEATTTDCICWSYQQEGHVFVLFNFIAGNQTWVYDISIGQWHERGTRDPAINKVNRYNPTYACFGNGEVLVGSFDGPQVLSLDLNYYKDYSAFTADNTIPIVRERISPIYWKDLKVMFHHEFQIDIETGVGLQEQVQGFDPQIMLQFSNDAGVSWSSEVWKSLGKIGEREVRVRWLRLGRTNNRVYRVMTSDPVKIIMLGAGVIASTGRNN